MPERIDLTAAETKPNNTRYEIDTLTIRLKAKTITVDMVGENGEQKSHVYGPSTIPTGAALITALNSSNNTSTSLIKRVYQRLIADGILAGTIAGVQD